MRPTEQRLAVSRAWQLKTQRRIREDVLAWIKNQGLPQSKRDMMGLPPVTEFDRDAKKWIMTMPKVSFKAYNIEVVQVSDPYVLIIAERKNIYPPYGISMYVCNLMSDVGYGFGSRGTIHVKKKEDVESALQKLRVKFGMPSPSTAPAVQTPVTPYVVPAVSTQIIPPAIPTPPGVPAMPTSQVIPVVKFPLPLPPGMELRDLPTVPALPGAPAAPKVQVPVITGTPMLPALPAIPAAPAPKLGNEHEIEYLDEALELQEVLETPDEELFSYEMFDEEAPPRMWRYRSEPIAGRPVVTEVTELHEKPPAKELLGMGLI